MAKELELVFKAGAKTLTINVKDPKDGLTLAQVEAAAAKLVPVLETTKGEAVTALEKAQIVTTEVTALT